MKQIRFLDLFSGMGGFRMGALNAKVPSTEFVPVAYCDNDSVCSDFYKSAFDVSTDELFVQDVYDIQTSHNGGIGTVIPEFDLLLGGFPCQPFANIGRHGGFTDLRGQLIFQIRNILETYKPRFFILENVQKLRNLGRGSALDQISSLLEDSGYSVTIWDLHASDYGIPQQRRRLFFCGAIKEDFSFYGPVSVPAPIDLASARYPTTWHLAERAMPQQHLVPPKTRETVLRPNPKWEGDLEINRRIARPLTATMAKWHRANQDNYFSENYVYAPTIEEYRATDFDVIKTPLRRISFLEGLRLQGFPDNLQDVFVSSGIRPTPAYRLLGNAVPVPLATAVIEKFVGHFS